MIIEILLLFLVIGLDPLVSVSLAISYSVVMAVRLKPQHTFLLVMLLGLMTDIIGLQTMGLMSLFLLTLSLVTYLLREQLGMNKATILVIVMSVMGELLMQWWQIGRISVMGLLSQGILSGLLWWGLSFVRPKSGVYLK